MKCVGFITVALIGCWILLNPVDAFSSSKLSELEAAHRDSSKIWARTLSESAEASMRVQRYKAAFEKRLRGVMRGQDTPAWLQLFSQDSLVEWIGNQRMLRQIARHDQITLEQYQKDLERLADLSVQEEENLRAMRSRRDALLEARRSYVEARWKSRVVKSASRSLVDKRNTRWPIPIEGRTLNLRYLGKASRPGLFFLARFGSPVQSVGPGIVLFTGEVRGFGQTVIVEHDDAVGVYAHLSKVMTHRLSRLEQGGLIGLSGDLSGERVSGLYFELRHGDTVSPLRVEAK